MGNQACPFYWGTGEACSEGKAQWVRKYSFTWSRLEQEINQNDRPVILGMHKYVGSDLRTHWVVVLDGSGTDTDGYTIHDPWPTNGANMRLSAYNDWYLDYLAIYSGQPDCGNLVVSTQNPVSFHPQPIRSSASFSPESKSNILTVSEAKELQASSVVTGVVELYRMTDVTATIQLEAESEVTNITEMLVWTDLMTEATWQPFSNFAYLAVGNKFYARFRDASGNTSEVIMDTLYPDDSPENQVQFDVYLPLILR